MCGSEDVISFSVCAIVSSRAGVRQLWFSATEVMCARKSLVVPLQGIHPYHSLSYTSGDTATDSPVHVGRAGVPVRESPRKESLLSYLTGSFPSLHSLLEGAPQRSGAAGKGSSLTRTGGPGLLVGVGGGHLSEDKASACGDRSYLSHYTLYLREDLGKLLLVTC